MSLDGRFCTGATAKLLGLTWGGGITVTSSVTIIMGSGWNQQTLTLCRRRDRQIRNGGRKARKENNLFLRLFFFFCILFTHMLPHTHTHTSTSSAVISRWTCCYVYRLKTDFIFAKAAICCFPLCMIVHSGIIFWKPQTVDFNVFRKKKTTTFRLNQHLWPILCTPKNISLPCDALAEVECPANTCMHVAAAVIGVTEWRSQVAFWRTQLTRFHSRTAIYGEAIKIPTHPQCVGI